MKKKDMVLALVLLGCLVVAAVAAAVLMPGEPDARQQAEAEYVISITEICAKNETVIADNNGKYRDYIELYNGGERVSLAGFCLTDGKERSRPFGDIVLEAGEYRVFFLSSEDTGFALSASGGDCVQLLDGSGRIVFQANTGNCGKDQVMLLRGSQYVLSTDASPGFSNDEAGLRAFREGSVQENPSLIISEVLIGNVSSLPDENGVYSDMIELHNASDEAVALGSWFISDDGARRFRYRLPELTLNPGEYLVLCCDGGNYISDGGLIHTNFALSVGETVYLTDRTGGYVAVEAVYAGEDVSLVPGESGYVAGPVSLGYANDEAGVYAFTQSRINTSSPLVVSEVLLSSVGIPYGGQICDAVEILNRSTQTVSTAGWYLSDGGDPYAYALEQRELAPGECLVLVCGPATTGFSLSAGETVYLTGPDYRMAPPVSCTADGSGQSICLAADSYSFAPVSLGFANDEAGQEAYLAQQRGGLFISEVMSANRSWLKGPYGDTFDWVELYNGSEESINLADYCLSDEAGEPGKRPLPEKTVEPGEYCVILLTDQTLNLPGKYEAVDLPMSSEGDRLYLTGDGSFIDYMLLPPLQTDVSYGRPDGSPVPVRLAQVTPGQPNSEAAQVSAMPTAVTAQGVYNGVEYVDVVLQGAGEIYYTTDCTTPGAKAQLYTGPIRLTGTTALRVVCREEGKEQSAVLDLTYVINENDGLDVVCLVTEDDHLWDYNTGIYVGGPGETGEFPFMGANYWKDLEYPATVSLFPKEGEGFTSPCGIKIFGAWSRALNKKSLSVMFRDVYGAGELTYPLFGEEGLDIYEAFVLRSSGQDAFSARMRDVLITSLAAEQTDLVVQRYRPVILYLNGEYWGLHYIREKINEHFVAGNANASPEDVTLAVSNAYGVTDYQDMVKFARTHDLNEQEHYDYLCSKMDVQEYMDYIIAQICIGNTDNVNVKFFTTEGGKWTWILYDTDLAFRSYSFNSVADHLNPAGSGSTGSLSTTLINALLDRDEFREAFLERLAWQMNNIWSEENINRRIDELVQTIGGDMEKECKRWKTPYKDWESSVKALRTFAKHRYGYLLRYIRQYFALSTEQMRQYGFVMDKEV